MNSTPKPPRFATSSVRGRVAVILVDNPPVNALSTGVPEAIVELLNAAAADSRVQAIVLAGAGRTFIAGVDIRELNEMTAGVRPVLNFNPFLLAIENSPKPVIAAIHGTALGGGLELAMAAHYRVVSPSAQLGQPEVKLGLIPGMAGTQRLPRLVGQKKAAEVCVWGEPLSASDAVTIGLADALVEGHFIDGAVAYAEAKIGQPIRKTRDLSPSPADLSPVRAKLLGFRRYGGAPEAALQAVEASTLPFFEGSDRERDLFKQRLASPEAKALIYSFFGERSVTRISAEALPVQTIGVIGAGTMGSGIAMAFADSGFNVVLKEAKPEALDRGVANIRSNYERSAAKGKIAPDEAVKRTSRIAGQLDFAGFEALDLIVEAAFENLSVKQAIFAELSAETDPHCLLATNTSSLDVAAIAKTASHPERILGLHFFSPANVSRLLEVIRTEQTSDAAVATGLAIGKRLNKVAVLTRNAPGFVGNRIFAPYFREARLFVEEGGSVDAVNTALTEWGMAMGPLAVDDLVGLDIALEIEELGKRKSPLLHSLVESGHLGQKSGQGWSRYDANRRPLPTESAAASATIPADRIVDRCINALVEECRLVLEEGIAKQAVDIDMVAIHGFGFPAWRGGPLFYAGLAQVMKR